MSNVNNTIPIGNVSGRPKTRRISSLPILSAINSAAKVWVWDG